MSLSATHEARISVVAFVGLVLLYTLTAPANHSSSVDAYAFARSITLEQTANPDTRHFLWLVLMRGLYSAATLVVIDLDPFRLIGSANAVQTALAVILFARLLMRDLSVSDRSAWLSAGLLGSSYGLWRYATEIEVYATATLVSVVLLLAAFAVGRGAPIRLDRRVLALACLGGAATLVYQPLGLLAGLAIPFHLLIVVGLRQVAIYCAVAGTIVIAGYSVAYQIGTDAPDANVGAFVVDAQHLQNPKPPDLMTLPKVAFALGHDYLSTNWSYAFKPFQLLFVRVAGRSLETEIYAAERAGCVIWVAALTLPSAALLLAVLIWTAFRHPATARLSPCEVTLVVWLAAHGAMMISLSPGGTEGWILALVPLTAIAARRLVAPAVTAGRSAIVLLLVGVFVVHNGFAGIRVITREDGDYLRAKGQPLVEQSGRGDLIVLSQDWTFENYLRYAGKARTLRINETGIDEARSAIDATLAAGGRVLIVDDIAWMPARLLAQDPTLARELDALARDYLGAAPRLPTGDTGWFYRIAPEDDGR